MPLLPAHGFRMTQRPGTSFAVTRWRIRMRRLVVSPDGLFKEYGLPQVLRTDNGTPPSGRFGIRLVIGLRGEAGHQALSAFNEGETDPEWSA